MGRNNCQLIIGIYVISALFTQEILASQAIETHAFDPLSRAEISIAREILKENNLLGQGYFLQLLALKEPAKAEFWTSSRNTFHPRHAKAIVLSHAQAKTYQCLIDLDAKQIISKTLVEKSQPALMKMEVLLLEKAIKSDPVWQAAMIKRNISDFSQIHVENWGPSDLRAFNISKEHRVFRSVFYFKGDAINPFGRPN